MPELVGGGVATSQIGGAHQEVVTGLHEPHNVATARARGADVHVPLGKNVEGGCDG